MTRTRTSSLESFSNDWRNRLDRALDIGLDDDVEFLHLALLHLVEEVVESNLLHGVELLLLGLGCGAARPAPEPAFHPKRR